MSKEKVKVSPRKKPRQERAKFTVDAIFKATTHILERDGYEKASTNRIAEKAGVSIGSLYQYFPSKDSIVSALVEQYIQKTVKDIEKKANEIEEQSDPSLENALRSLITVVLENKRKHARFNKILSMNLFRFGALEISQKMDEYMIEKFKEKLDRYKDEIRDDNIDLALYVVTQSLKLVPMSFLFSNDYDIKDERLLDEFTRLAYRYLKK